MQSFLVKKQTLCEQTQIFIEQTKVSWGNTILLLVNAYVLWVNAKVWFLKKLLNFSSKSFLVKSKNKAKNVSECKISWETQKFCEWTVFLRDAKLFCVNVRFLGGAETFLWENKVFEKNVNVLRTNVKIIEILFFLPFHIFHYHIPAP